MISKVVTNGCSWMAGMGCRAKPSADGTGTRRDISSLFANKYMADDINLSIGGGSNPRIIRTSIDWLQHFYGFYLDEPIRTGVLFYKAVSNFKPNSLAITILLLPTVTFKVPSFN